MKRKKKGGFARLLSMALGFVCALVLGALFYGTMVYQLGDVQTADTASTVTPAPLGSALNAQALFPGALLALDGEIMQETVEDELCGETVCRVVTRTYAFPDGITATAVSAYPAEILAQLAEAGFVPQLITGFSLAGLNAVCEQKDGRSLLVAREGECVYLLEAQADEQTLYALGAAAKLE